MKKFLAAVCAVALLSSMALTGCLNNGEEAPAASGGDTSGAAGNEQVNLRMAWWGSQTRHDMTIKVIDTYQAANPNVKIEYEFSGFDTYWDKLATEAASDTLPDIWQNSTNYILSYAEKNQLLDLTPYTKDGTIDLSDWDKSVAECGMLDNKIYGLSMGSSAWAMFYDPAILKQAGLEAPKSDWTWDDYKEYVKTIKEKTGVYGDSTFAGAKDMENFNFYLRENGKELYTADRKALGYDDDKLFIDANQMGYDLIKAGYIMPLDQAVGQDTIEQTAVVTGKAAMLGSANSNQFAAAVKAAGRELGICAPPTLNGKSGAWTQPSMYISASAKNANEKESAKFINYILNSADANKILLGERGVPGGSKARDAIKSELDASGQQVIDYVSEMMKVATPFDAIKPAAAAEIDALYDKLVQDMMFDKTSVADAAKEFRTQAAALLAK